MVTITPAAPATLPAAAAVLGEAFEGDPVLAAVTGTRSPSRERLAALFAPVLRSGALPAGGVEVARDETGAVVGVAAWEPPGSGGHLTAQILELPALLRALGLRGVLAAARVQSLLARHRPTAPHWYLAQIGVSARARGQGVGSALLQDRLRAIDAEGAAAYLEASNEINRRLYERHGFRATATIPGISGARPTAMWRAPRLAAG